MIMYTWVVFLFAPGLPILFPIGLLALIILYVNGRLQLAYYCRRPPVYDERMNETSIRLLGFAPLLYCSMAVFVYSNRCTFYNDVYANTNAGFFSQEHDRYYKQVTSMSPAIVFLVYLCLVIILFLS